MGSPNAVDQLSSTRHRLPPPGLLVISRHYRMIAGGSYSRGAAAAYLASADWWGMAKSGMLEIGRAMVLWSQIQGNPVIIQM
jgi:hypothetical protein